MPTLFASLAPCFAGFWGEFNLQTVIAVGSACLTAYYWLLKRNQDRSGLKLYRVADFRPDRLQCSNAPGKETATWYGEVYLANPTSLPAAVVRFQVRLQWGDRWIDGRLVLEKKDDTPWMIEPLRVLARSFGCAFPVEEGTTREQLLRPHKIRFTWTTVDGKQQSQEVDTSLMTTAPAVKLAA